MADIEFYEDDSDNAQDDGVDDSGLGIDDLDVDPYNPDEGLSPLQKLEKYIESDHIFSRQMVARNLLDTMRQVGDNAEEATAILQSMVRLSEDPEATVRIELMEQVPHIAMYCLENKHLFQDPIPTHLLPIIVKYLTDSNSQVRKTKQAALLVLLEQDLIEKADIEEQVCPVLMQLSDPESTDDMRTEAVAVQGGNFAHLDLGDGDISQLEKDAAYLASKTMTRRQLELLMSKMAPVIGKDLTVGLFLGRFATMCTDALFHVRKVCAANFGDMCTVVGQENTEKVLLPKFYYLCEDAVWGVRKACAECFMQVSCACSLEVRRNELAELFISLICDQSRWVRMSAFQGLGGFISTFADPSITGLYFSEDGILVAGNPEEFLKKSVAQASLQNCCGPELEEEEEEHPCQVPSQTNSDPTPVSPSNCDEEIPDPDAPGSDKARSSPLEERMEIETEDSGNEESLGQTPDVSVEELRAKKYYSKAAESKDGSRGDHSTLGSSCGTPVDAEECRESTTEESVEKPGGGDSLGTGAIGRNKINLRIQMDNFESFNSFQYWREPLPDIEVTLDSDVEALPESDTLLKTELPAEKSSVENVDVESAAGSLEKVELANDSEELKKIHTADVSEMCAEVEEVANIGSMHVLGQQVDLNTMEVVNGVVEAETSTSGLSFCLGEEATSPSCRPGSNVDLNSSSSSIDFEQQQDVIPQALLDHYLSMIDPSRAQTVDIEIARHCAYSLPAVAYTLGRKNWPFLRELYDTLAGDMQWKVRRTLAFSIHELAIIVGEDVTCDDLVPVFNGFIRDLDEVRIGVLKHLTDFLRLLKPDLREEYLNQIADFLNTDNNRNWRFREELAQQLLFLIELYSPERICQYLFPVALALALDKVAAVRHRAFGVLSAILRRLNRKGDQQLAMSFINDLIEKFARSHRWNHRQMFAQICSYILDEQSTTQERFARDLLPSLLALGSDDVANVRISLSRTIAAHILDSDYFTSPLNPHHGDLLSVIRSLQSDPDRDVRYFLTVSPQTDLSDSNSIPV